MPVKVVLGQNVYDNADVNENDAWGEARKLDAKHYI